MNCSACGVELVEVAVVLAGREVVILAEAILKKKMP